MAEHASEMLTEKAYKEKLEEAREELKTIGLAMYEKYVPKAVRDAAKAHIEILEDTSSLRFVVEGASSWDYKNIYYNERFPRLKPIILTAKDWKTLCAQDRLVNQLEKEKREYCDNVEQALMNLRTEKNVREQFPEALPFMTFTTCTALVPNLNALRMKLK
jgi:hypothetical protein